MDCLSYKNGSRSALRDTNFKRECPFYCTLKMVIVKLPKELAREVFERYGKSKEFHDFYPND